MTVQKALQGLQVMIAHDEKIVQGMNKYIVDWTNLDEKPDLATRAAIIKVGPVNNILVHSLYNFFIMSNHNL